MSLRTPPLFERFKKQASDLVKNPGKVLDKIAKADAKADKENNVIKKFFEDIKLLIRLVRAWAKGEYKEVPTMTIILAIAAIIYFLSPIDAIPDWIPLFGYSDDAAVVAFVMWSIKSDLDKFRAWES